MGKIDFDKMVSKMIEPEYIEFFMNPDIPNNTDMFRRILLTDDTIIATSSPHTGEYISEDRMPILKFLSMDVESQIRWVIFSLERLVSTSEEYLKSREKEYLKCTAFNAEISTDDTCDEITVAFFSLPEILLLIRECYVK